MPEGIDALAIQEELGTIIIYILLVQWARRDQEDWQVLTPCAAIAGAPKSLLTCPAEQLCPLCAGFTHRLESHGSELEKPLARFSGPHTAAAQANQLWPPSLTVQLSASAGRWQHFQAGSANAYRYSHWADLWGSVKKHKFLYGTNRGVHFVPQCVL